MQFKYEVVISFAGEDRAIAESIAHGLKSNGVTYFYDYDEQPELWGKDLAEHLEEVYSKHGRYCLMIISQHYASKMWTRHERRNALARALQQPDEYILPLRLDATELPGLRPTIGYLDFGKVGVDGVVKALLAKLGTGTPKEPEASAAPHFQVPMPHISKSFTQRDKDRFLSDAFGFVRLFFQRGCTTLSQHDERLEGELENFTQQAFLATYYVNGSVGNRCKVWITSHGPGSAYIAYFEGPHVTPDDTAQNEMLYVEIANDELGLNPMMGDILGRAPGKFLSKEAAADYLWRRFIKA